MAYRIKKVKAFLKFEEGMIGESQGTAAIYLEIAPVHSSPDLLRRVQKKRGFRLEMGGWVHPGFEPGTSRSIAQDVP